MTRGEVRELTSGGLRLRLHGRGFICNRIAFDAVRRHRVVLKTFSKAERL